MENRKHEENSDEKLRYQNAQKRVKEIRGFYAHLISYVAVNIVLTCCAFRNLKEKRLSI